MYIVSTGERMKKVLIFLLVAGVLVLGTCAIAEEISEEISFERVDFSEGENPDPSPCGGGDGQGPGGIPG